MNAPISQVKATEASSRFAFHLISVFVALLCFALNPTRTILAQGPRQNPSGEGCPAATFAGTGVGAIPDGGPSPWPNYGPPLVISFSVSGVTAPLSAISTNISLTHTWCGDIDMVLAAPGGQTSLITVSRIGVTTAGGTGSQTDYDGTYNFTDTAVGPNIWSAMTGTPIHIPSGDYRTTEGGGLDQTNPPPFTSLMATFGGLSTGEINGIWTLTIRDAAAADTGAVTAANLTLAGLCGPNTQPGNNVTVPAPSGNASVTFTQVTAGGSTTFTPINPASAGQLPAGYQLSAESTALDITTTAAVAAPIDVSFYFPSITSAATFASLRILHGESGTLIDHTVQHDFASKTIRARVSSLSPFVVAQATAAPNRLLNVSTRLRVETGDSVLIAGFIITGTDQKQVIIRGIGPSLSGVPDAVPNTTLQLYQGGTLLAENDNWKDTQQAAIEATGIPPSNELESAIVQILSPGTYTAILRGKDNATGIGVVEAYDLSPAAEAKLANISTRGFVATGDTVLIGGFIVGSTSGTPAAVVVRAIGPSLSDGGISGALANPTLDLYNGSGTAIASNDDWKATQQGEIAGTGVAPNDDSESAIVATLAPGNYTAIVRGAGNTTGIGLVEVYYLQ